MARRSCTPQKTMDRATMLRMFSLRELIGLLFPKFLKQAHPRSLAVAVPRRSHNRSFSHDWALGDGSGEASKPGDDGGGGNWVRSPDTDFDLHVAAGGGAAVELRVCSALRGIIVRFVQEETGSVVLFNS